METGRSQELDGQPAQPKSSHTSGSLRCPVSHLPVGQQVTEHVYANAIHIKRKIKKTVFPLPDQETLKPLPLEEHKEMKV